MNGEEKPSFVSKIVKYIPAVEKPLYKQSFNTRLKWTGLALFMYLVLSNIPTFGISGGPQSEYFKTIELLLGAKFGSLMTLGIGPIVTAGIILQLLVGSKILNWDTKTPEGRKKFQTWNKLLAVAFSFIEAVAYVLAGALGPVLATSGMGIAIAIILQLAMGGVLVILLDELVSKWGFGSGVSLFIAAGVGSQIMVGVLSPFTAPGGGYVGRLWGFLASLLSGETTQALVYFLPLISTVAVFLIVVYAQNIRVDVPLAFGALRGFGRTWSLKLFYTSNIPVILVAALLANVQLMARVGITPDPTGLSCGLMGCFDQQGSPVSGVAYYLSAPRNLLVDLFTFSLVPTEILRAMTYMIFMAMGAMIFSLFWVNTAGMDAKSVAEQIESVGMHIPGYRRDPRIIESVLNRYIPALTILGGLAVGLLAAFADFTGALGTGTGILLTVMIIYNYYEELRNQDLEEAHPIVRKIFGE